MGAAGHKSGFAALLGRPNVGKSTLLNRLTGEKLAIVSPKPQTTRRRILGVVTRYEGQVAFVDTPGVHQAKGALNKMMVEQALSAADECDLVLFVIEAEGQKEGREVTIGEGNRFILSRLKASGKPTLLLINKIDTVKRVLLLPLIDRYRTEFPFAEVLPVSARESLGIDELWQAVVRHMPEAPPMYDADMLTDQAERTLVEELVREQILRHCRQELPYSTAVVVDVFDESEREPQKGKTNKKSGLQGLVRIGAHIFVERESQKAIVVGRRGQMLKTIGTDARKAIERLLRANVYLALQVKVEPRWSERHEALRKMGYGQEG
ncbi:MAG: GTPase Era [Myxococcaceae bacterium]|nr:GTPase Era [Myxococcaceae bacterium]